MTYCKFVFFAIGLFFYSNLLAIPDSTSVSEKFYLVDSIAVSGNNITEDFIILRELNFGPGDIVSETQLQFNKERIFSLRLFTKVDLYPVTVDDKIIIQIDVKESWYIYPIPFIRRQDGSISKLSYGINFSFKNFRGRNEHLRAIIGLGYDPFLALVYQNPALDYKRNLLLGFSLFLLKMNNKSSTAQKIYGSDFKYKFYSSEIDLGKRLNQFNEVFIGVGYDYIEGPESPLPKITASGEKVDRVLSLTLGYSYDTRDLKQFSQNGIFSFMYLKHKGFGFSNINYYLIGFDFREYRPVIDDFSARWRFVIRHTFGRSVPFYDYSYLGFEEYVRGYSNENYEGNNYLLSSIEFSYPILKEFDFSIKLPLIPQQLTSARIGVYLSAFADAGQVFDNNQRFRFSSFNTGYGFGLTFLVLPYNAIRFEYAFNKLGKGELLIGTGFSF